MDNTTNNWKEFTLGNPQEEVPRRVEKKRRGRVRLLVLMLAAALVTALVLLWDQSSFDGLRRSIIYATAKKDASGCALLYQYVGDKTSCFAALEGSLIDLSNNQLMLINEKGEDVVNKSIRFTAPALASNAQRAVAYDVGGRWLHVMNQKGIAWQLETEGDILSVSINDSNYVTVTANKSGYKAAVCVYGADGAPVFEFDSADRFAVTAALSRDSRTLLAVTIGQEESSFTSYAVVYRVNADRPQAVTPVCHSMIYTVGWVGDRFCAVAEDGLYFIDTGGNVTATYSYGDNYLRRCDLSGGGYAALLLSHYRSGSQETLLAINADGEVLGSCELDSEILSMSAAGRYIGLLCGDHLEIYDKELKQVARLEDVSEARQVLMRSDGSAVLAGTASASLYLP